MQETPIKILQKKLDYYNNFLKTVKDRVTFKKNKDMTNDQFETNLNNLEADILTKIREFKRAIEILNKTA